MADLQGFINQYSGVANVGDTPENKGQCVGLIEVWLDEVNGNSPHHIYGNAKDLMANADKNIYTVTTYTPGAVPQPGDVLCFDGAYGGGYGHTGVVVSANSSQVVLFQQNDPEGSTPHEKTYSYAHCMGWIRDKALDNGSMMMVNENMAIDMGVGILGRSLDAAHDPTYIKSVVGQPADVVIRNLTNSPEAVAFRDRAAVGSNPTTLKPGIYKVG